MGRPCSAEEQLERGGASHLSGPEALLHRPQLPQGVVGVFDTARGGPVKVELLRFNV